MDQFLLSIYWANLTAIHTPIPYDNSITFIADAISCLEERAVEDGAGHERGYGEGEGIGDGPDDSHSIYGIRLRKNHFRSHARLIGVGYGKGTRDDIGTLQGFGMSMDLCGASDGTSDLDLPF